MVVLSGASSIGKTTLAKNWCERHPEFCRIDEVARVILSEKGISRRELLSYQSDLSNGKFLQFQCQIFDRQNYMESKISKEESVIVDRGPDPLAFVEHFISRGAALKLAEYPAAKTCLERYRSRNCVVVILCPLDSIEDDNVRDVPTRCSQLRYTECLKDLLKELNVPYVYCDKTDLYERIMWLEKMICMRG